MAARQYQWLTAKIRNSSALAMELRLSCTKTSIFCCQSVLALFNNTINQTVMNLAHDPLSSSDEYLRQWNVSCLVQVMTLKIELNTEAISIGYSFYRIIDFSDAEDGCRRLLGKRQKCQRIDFHSEKATKNCSTPPRNFHEQWKWIKKT